MTVELLPLVQALASLDIPWAERNRVSRELDTLLRQNAHKLFRSLSSLTPEDRDDALQHVLLKASTGSARCQAQHEAGAWSWCITVARNYGLGLLEDRPRMNYFEESRGETHRHLVADANEQDVLRRQLQEVLGEAIEHIRALPQGAAKEHGIQCAVEHVFEGVDIATQITTWGFPGGAPASPTPTEQRQARDRVYAYRSRGILYLLQALDELEALGKTTAEDTAFLRQLLAQKTRKKKAAVRTSS